MADENSRLNPPVCHSIARALEHMVGKTYAKCVNVATVSERCVTLRVLRNKSVPVKQILPVITYIDRIAY